MTVTNIITLLIMLSVLMASLGGLSDFTGKKLIVSKEHYWHDASYLLLLAIVLKVVYV